jgi:MiaB-like tRNA modifying enzyme
MEIYFETYGCQANQNNTEIMKGLVRQAGLEITGNLSIADIIVINTCIVKGRTEKKIERRIKDLSKLGKPVIVSGCLPEVRKNKEYLDNENIYLLGTHHFLDINKLIRKISENKRKEFLDFKNEEKLLTGKIPKNKKIGITQISEGCLGNCSFCLVKYAKGKLFSYQEDKIIKNIKNDLEAGAKIVHLTSQDNASYGLPEERNFPGLLKKISKLKGNFKIKIGMMNPDNVLPILNDLIKIYKNKKVEKFLHLPVQSGSNKILKKMNRKYKIGDFIKIVKRFKEEISDLELWTDIIVGFPGETREDFEKTKRLLKHIKFNKINLSRFWKREGTKAAEMKQLSQQIIKKRVKELIKSLPS